MATITLRNIHKNYGDVEVIRGVDLDVQHQEFVVIVGPSGCGKSTLLRLIAGLEEIHDGELFIDGQKANDIPPAERGVAMVFQNYALYPHMSVADNMAFSLRLAGVPKTERHNKVREVARMLQLQDLLHRKPRALSGGERQRVAIGRAIVRNPKAFLFDEPLSNLDASLRVQMRLELARLHDRLNATMIYVTHDQVEAITMADKIVVLNNGLIEQVGSPLELYHHPRNLFVAGFIGSPKMNLLDARVTSIDPESVQVKLPGNVIVPVPVEGEGLAVGENVTFGIRSEHLQQHERGQLSGEVLVAERLGGETFLYVRIADDNMLVVKADGGNPTQVHDQITVRIDGEPCHLFNSTGQALPHLHRHPLADAHHPTRHDENVSDSV